MSPRLRRLTGLLDGWRRKPNGGGSPVRSHSEPELALAKAAAKAAQAVELGSDDIVVVHFPLSDSEFVSPRVVGFRGSR